MLRSALDHYRRQQRLTAAALLAVRRSSTASRIVEQLLGFKLLAVQDAVVAVGLMLAEQRITAPAVAGVNVPMIAATAADGRTLLGLARLITELRDDEVSRIVATEMADAGRAGAVVGMAVRPEVTAYARMLVPPSCSRCAILAGRIYKTKDAFERHPRCFPAGVTISGPAVDAATRRWYEGELVVITTASGQNLPTTGNHPVLTDRGWLPANLLKEGDNVVRSLRAKGAGSLVVPDEDQMPARIEDLWRPDSMVTLRQVPTSAEDFHGDGGHGEVDVVLADRLLWGNGEAAVYELVVQELLAGAVAPSPLLPQLRAAHEEVARLLRSAHGLMGGGSLLPPLVGGHAGGAHQSSGGAPAWLDTLIGEALSDHVTAHPVSNAQRVLALPGLVGRSNLGTGERQVAPRWDAPAGPFTMESRGGYASRGEDLRLRLAGEVALDRVVDVRRVQWSGHVYNLTSVEGWYSANGLIVSNCDCRHIPSTEVVAGDLVTDPSAYFDSLSLEEQNRVFTNAGARAIREGADMGRVVNARRGMSMAQVAGRELLVTSERARRGRVRLMPESIFEVARSREEALRLLRTHGYIV